MNQRETAAGTVPVVTALYDKKEVTLIRGSGNRQQRQTFHFDSVFTSFSTQREVFETVRPLVNEVMQGFEATVRSALITESSAPLAPSERDMCLVLSTRVCVSACRCSRMARLVRARRTLWRETLPPMR